MNELVSVIIPTYGGGEFVARAVNSVLNQTYKNIEVIVVDDNGLGTEKQLITAQRMQCFRDIGNVKYVCHEINKNGSAARNTGVKSSSGEYIALLDDDDIYYPEKIAKQVECFDQLPDEYGMVFSGLAIYENDKKIREKKAVDSENWLFDLLVHNIAIGSSTLMVKRSVWVELNGFDESFRRHQDYEFSARVAASYKIKAVDYIGGQYNLEYRNSPKTAEIAYQYREHYLTKMMPYIDRLSKRQQREVLVRNRVDIAIQYVKEKDFKSFFKRYFEAKPGLIGLFTVIRRLIKFIK